MAEGALGGGGFFGLCRHKAALSLSAGKRFSFFSSFKTSQQMRGSHLLLHFKELHKVVGEDALPPADLTHPPAGVRTLLQTQHGNGDGNSGRRHATSGRIGPRTDWKRRRTSPLTFVTMLMISPSFSVSSSSFCASYAKSTLHSSRPDTQIQKGHQTIRPAHFPLQVPSRSFNQPHTIILIGHGICLLVRQNQEVSEEVKNKPRK